MTRAGPGLLPGRRSVAGAPGPFFMTAFDAYQRKADGRLPTTLQTFRNLCLKIAIGRPARTVSWLASDG